MSRERRSGSDRRASLLQAALDLFSTLGYDATTTRAIAERGEVTEALLFKHFRSKEELLVAVIEDYGPSRQIPLPEGGIDGLTAGAALSLVIRHYLDGFWANRACLRMMFMATWSCQEAFRPLREHSLDRRQRLEEFLADRARRGELRAGAEHQAAQVISASITGFLFQSMRAEPPDWPEARDEFVGSLLGTILAGISGPALNKGETPPSQ